MVEPPSIQSVVGSAVDRTRTVAPLSPRCGTLLHAPSPRAFRAAREPDGANGWAGAFGSKRVRTEHLF